MITGKNYIGNEMSAIGSVRFKTMDPKMNSENEWTCFEATTKEIHSSVDKAWKAFKVFRNTSQVQRSTFLNAIADEIEALGDVLLDTYCKESGLPKGRAIGERGRTIFQLRTFADLLESEDWKLASHDAAIPDRQPTPKLDLKKTVIPLGPVAVFGSSNFPLAYSTAGGDTASALAAGCPVVVKSHPMHAGTGELIASAVIRAAKRTKMPDGVFSNLNSKGIEVGIELVNHPKIKAVGFTGSIKAGRALFDIANARPEPIPVFAEMGSINPVVITQNALISNGPKWAEAYAHSIVLGAGQFCTNPGLILAIDSEALSKFTDQLAEKTATLDPMCMLHPKIKAAYSNLKFELTAQNGVEVISNEVHTEKNYADQTIATVSGTQFLLNPKLHAEVFGPFSIVVKCRDQQQLLQIIGGLEGQLTGTILAEKEDSETLTELVDELQQRVGRLIYNGVPTGVEVCPSMNHGGPYPASTDARFTAVGTDSIRRWVRLVAYQNFPFHLIPNKL